MPSPRRFPPLWTIEEHNDDACFIVRDSIGQALGYFYFEDEPARRSAAKLLTRDEARRLVERHRARVAMSPQRWFGTGSDCGGRQGLRAVGCHFEYFS